LHVLTKREQKLIERLKAAGYPIRHDRDDAPFMFLIRPLTTVGVDIGLSSLFEDEMLAEIKETQFESPISAILVSPIIINPAIALPPPDGVTYKRGEKSIFSCINLEFEIWHRASKVEKLTLLSENVRKSINAIARRYLLEEDCTKLHRIVDRVQKRLVARLVN